ncbi:MAG: DNA topoisomerase IV subunit A [Alphaproteobacteria bacterium]|nr:DNA topoisomerase IV subunit A [Alphaproteobacteria bacterium]
MVEPKKTAGEIRPVPLADALGERYLSYALSTIMARSLPDVRDGLKPVHRRLLYAMRELHLNPASGFKKCARIVGDVMGKYHPHGDAAIYDAMVRLAQDFAVRYPLVDGQGNFGNVDGDNAAAMRYTEARLTETAQRLLEGIDEDAVDFRPTYDGEGEEPIVLPANFPNLLANGAAGIAVGMATSIPPHNVAEICDALLHLIKAPNATIAKLIDFMPGPDFPTGGVLCESRETVIEAYKTGRGSFRVRAKYEIEKIKGGGYQIVITGVPYQVQKAKLVERIAELMHNRKLTMLEDVHDESTTEVRLVLEPKSRNVDPELLMESLFRQTDLETRISLNMNVLDGGLVPRVMDLREVLRAFLDHRHDVLVRRTKHRLGKIEQRLEILDGLLIAYLNLDEVIRIIREEDDPKADLIKAFKLTDAQAEAILNMRLRHLRKLEEMEIRNEHAELTQERKDLNKLLKDEDLRWKRIAGEIGDIRKAYGKDTELGRRRTELGEAPSAVVIPLEAMIEREPVTVICSDKGWIRAAKGHLPDIADIKYKEGDRQRFAFHAQTTDKLIIFATNGRFYTIGVDKLPGGRGFGEPLSLMIELGNEHGVVALTVHDPERKLLVASSDGRGFIVAEKDVAAQTRAGKQVLNVSGDVEATVCSPVVGDSVAVVGENRKMLIFPLDELPEMTRGRGVMLQRYNARGLADAVTYDSREGLAWRIGDRTRVETDLKDWIGKRAQAGRKVPRGFPSNTRFSK